MATWNTYSNFAHTGRKNSSKCILRKIAYRNPNKENKERNAHRVPAKDHKVQYRIVQPAKSADFDSDLYFNDKIQRVDRQCRTCSKIIHSDLDRLAMKCSGMRASERCCLMQSRLMQWNATNRQIVSDSCNHGSCS